MNHLNKKSFPLIITALMIFLMVGVQYAQEKKLTFEKTMLFSLKGGYHTDYKLEEKKGFPGGFIADASFSYGLNKVITLGLNVEFWNMKNISKPNIEGRVTVQNISAVGYGAACNFRLSVFKASDIYAGIGFGKYRINRENTYYGTNSEDFLRLFLAFGADTKLYNNFFLTGECNITGLIGRIDFAGGDPDPAFINYKLGITYLLKIP